MRAIALALGLSLTQAVPPAVQADYYLDLLNHRSQKVSTSAGDSRLEAGFPGRGRYPLGQGPISIEFLTTDKDAYSPGSAVVYEVLLVNTSGAPVQLPWLPDVALLPAGRSEPGLRQSSIGIVIESGDGLGDVVTRQILWGSDSVPRSTVTLQSGRRAWIRASGRFALDIDKAAAIRTRTGGRVAMKAVYTNVPTGAEPEFWQVRSAAMVRGLERGRADAGRR